MQDQDLEKRVHRLELLHVYGIGAIVIFAIGYFALKSKK